MSLEKLVVVFGPINLKKSCNRLMKLGAVVYEQYKINSISSDSICSFCRPRNVWMPTVQCIQSMAGRARFAEAEQSRRIRVEEARAQLEAEKLNAKSEIERAKGVAEANKIIGNSLKGNESYLRYLWIQNMNTDKEVIYIPTEAGLPILEAGKR